MKVQCIDKHPGIATLPAVFARRSGIRICICRFQPKSISALTVFIGKGWKELKVKKRSKKLKARLRAVCEAAVLILWPTLMSATRCYHDAGTVFGDMIVAAMYCMIIEIVIRETRKEHK